MITSLFLNVVYSFLGYFIALLPLGSGFPASWTTGVYTIWAGINAFSFIVPVDVLLYALGIALTFHLFQFGWNFMHWIYGLLRGNRMH